MEEKNDNIILIYRKKHPRCRYCVFHKFHSIPMGYGYWECMLKDKLLYEYILHFLYNLQGCFCKWFKPKEDCIDI